MDLLLHLSDGSPVQSISSHLWAAATMGDADDVVKAWVRLESGQLLDLEINTASAQPLAPAGGGGSDHHWHLAGTHGTAVLSGKDVRPHAPC